ncbi:MAG TPA: hypothetical protein VM513_27280 [Kofleriaceae bacterium]|jgi:hypothetical protein|nr:hypothetical protein [Kofleriaceae bacterium]
MSHRLQVLVDEREFREIRKLAKEQGLSVAEWVRRALDAAKRQRAAGDPAKKLAAVRLAAKHSFPTADIDQMLNEIASGYGDLPA